MTRKLVLAQLKLTGKSDDETARAGARTHSRSRSGFDSAMPAQKLSEARWRSGYRTASATMMSLSQTSVVPTSAQRPSRETVIPPSSAIRDTRKGSVPTRCPIPSLNRYKLMASASGSKLTKTFFDDQPFASRWRERVSRRGERWRRRRCLLHTRRSRPSPHEGGVVLDKSDNRGRGRWTRTT